MWVKLLVTAWVAWMVQTKQERSERGPTWAEVMSTLPHVPPAAPSPSVSKSDNTTDFRDYDEDFFSNHDYVYVDTEDTGYRQPPLTQKEGDTPQTAERRTFDFLFHTFMDHARGRTQNGRPGRGTTTRRPTLIEAVFKTIDDHIVQDLQEWATYTAQLDAQAANTPPTQGESQQFPVIQQASPENEELLFVTDEQGQQHIVTINDIVSSLGHLDEQTLTNLLLSPEQGVASERSTRWALPPEPSPVLEESASPPSRVPIVLGIKKKNNEELSQPERHKGPAKTNSDAGDDTYVVRDEHGVIHVITLQDILASLTQLNSNSVNDLLFAETGGETLASLASAPPGHTPSPQAGTGTVAPKSNSKWRETSTNNPFPTPTIIKGDDNHIITHRGSVGLDPQTSSQETGTKNKPQGIRGPLPSTHDRNNSIHIISDSNQQVNIQSILPPTQAAMDTNTKDLPSAAKPPASASHKVYQPIASQSEHYPVSVNSLHQPLMGAIQQQPEGNRLVKPTVQYILSPSTVQPVVQPVAKTSSAGVGVTLSSLLSRLVGQATGQQAALPQEPQQQQEQQIKLVVKQQGQHAGDDVLGEMTIPLPKPIHFQQTQHPTYPTMKPHDPVQASSRDSNDPLPPILHTLSPAVQEALRRQINSIPRFIPPGAQQRALSTATARMDVVPMERLDNKREALSEAATTVMPNIPPALLTTLPPAVLQKLRQQLGNSHTWAPQKKPTPTLDHTKPLDRSSYAELPYDHHGHYDNGHYDYGGYDIHGHTYEEEKNPLFDIFLLADVTKVYKVGDTNLSFKAPKIGDASQFVNTHSYYGHHHH